MEICEPRRRRISSASSCNKSWGALPKNTSPVTTACGGSRRMVAREVTDFPEPDSPTSPRTSPAETVKLTLQTAVSRGGECDTQVSNFEHTHMVAASGSPGLLLQCLQSRGLR